jgi:hypothetical protein
MRALTLLYISLIGGPTRRAAAYVKPNYLNLTTWTLHLCKYKTHDIYGDQVIGVNSPELFNAFNFDEETIDRIRETIVEYYARVSGDIDHIEIFTSEKMSYSYARNHLSQGMSTMSELRNCTATILYYRHPGTASKYAELYGHSESTHIDEYINRDAYRASGRLPLIGDLRASEEPIAIIVDASEEPVDEEEPIARESTPPPQSPTPEPEPIPEPTPEPIPTPQPSREQLMEIITDMREERRQQTQMNMMMMKQMQEMQLQMAAMMSKK